MLNTDNFALLQGVMLESMAKEINKKLPESDQIGSSAEEVFKNLTSISETVVDRSFGEDNGSYDYMPLQYKSMVMRLVAPEYCPSVRTMLLNDEGVYAEAFLFLSPEDTKPVASGKMFVSFSSVRERFPKDETQNLRFFTEELAKGSALSKAYEKFGIGSWFKRKFTSDDNPDKVLSDLESQNKVQPVTAYDTESGKTTPETEAPVPAQESTPAPAPEAEKPQAPVKPAKEPAKAKAAKADTPAVPSEAPEADNDLQVTLEEAKTMKATVGKAASMGLTLGETAEKFPGNILWMYTQDVSAEEKAALSVIAKSNPKISDLFKQRGVAL